MGYHELSQYKEAVMKDRKTTDVKVERRAFLKKAAYVVPTIVGLGYLSDANAMGHRGGRGHVTFNGHKFTYKADASKICVRRG